MKGLIPQHDNANGSGKPGVSKDRGRKSGFEIHGASKTAVTVVANGPVRRPSWTQPGGFCRLDGSPFSHHITCFHTLPYLITPETLSILISHHSTDRQHIQPTKCTVTLYTSNPRCRRLLPPFTAHTQPLALYPPRCPRLSSTPRPYTPPNALVDTSPLYPSAPSLYPPHCYCARMRVTDRPPPLATPPRPTVLTRSA